MLVSDSRCIAHGRRCVVTPRFNVVWQEKSYLDISNTNSGVRQLQERVSTYGHSAHIFIYWWKSFNEMATRATRPQLSPNV